MAYLLKRMVACVLFALLGAFALGQGGIRGAMYNDMNANGVRDLVDIGIPYGEFTLVGPFGMTEVRANAMGDFSQMDLPAGEYDIIASLDIYGTPVTPAPNGVIHFELAPGMIRDISIGFHETCVTYDRERTLVNWEIVNGQTTGNAIVRLYFKNNNTFPIGWIYVTPTVPSTMTILSAQPLMPVPNPVPPGGIGCVEFRVSGLPAGGQACFSLAFHEPNLVRCCEEPICIEVPVCECWQEIRHTITCDENGNFQFSFTIQSLYPQTINQIWIFLPGVTVPVVLNQNLSFGQFFTYSGSLNNPALGGQVQCFKIGFYAGGTFCCVKDLCFRFPECDLCDNRPAICYAERPNYNFVDPAGRTYNGTAWSSSAGQTVSAITCWATTHGTKTVNGVAVPFDDPVVAYMNQAQYQCDPEPNFGTADRQQDWVTSTHTGRPSPRGFHNGLTDVGDAPGSIPVPEWAKWTKKYMGNVFALTFDNQGNLYVAQSSSYNTDYAPDIQTFNARIPGTGDDHTASPNEVASRRLHGRIFKIDNITGKVTIFNEDTGTTFATWNGMPSGQDPAVTTSYGTLPTDVAGTGEQYPEIGDITFDYSTPGGQIFATCMDDGKIYRYNMSGVKLDSFDPFGADAGTPYGDGFAGLGEVLWAIKFHKGRLYFSRWVEDFDHTAPTTFPVQGNAVYSIPIAANGAFIPSSAPRLELEVPAIPANAYGGNVAGRSAAISDISFTSEPSTTGVPFGRMVLAERGMGADPSQSSFWAPGNQPQYGHMWTHASGANASFTSTYPHRARGLVYQCDPNTHHWTLVGGAGNGVPPLYLGIGSHRHDSSGGVDFDFDTRNCSGGILGNRLWFTSDYMVYTGAPQNISYGLQGVPLSGGNLDKSIAIDLNGSFDTRDKTTPGDVEIPCPQADLGGTTKWCDFPPNIALPVSYDVRTLAGVVVYSVEITPDAEGRFMIALPSGIPPGEYVLRAKSSHWLRRSTHVIVGDPASANLLIELYNGDVNGDNEVDIADFALLSDAYGTSLGEPGWLSGADLNGDDLIDIADYAILSANFGRVGDD